MDTHADTPEQNTAENEEQPRRLDKKTAQVVENGLLLQQTSGTDRAAEYMKSYGVSFEVAMRVLSRPNSRRKPSENK
ncbi:MAG: hypothetical protein H6R04_1051 [Burkholderiaceae bacterium]|nr:hypothetical protein [Burkholderiaceae bacterium]